MSELELILGMMAVTVVVRYPVLALVGRFDIPEPVYRVLRYVPVAVLTAISMPAILMPDGALSVGYDNAHLVAAVVAILAAWRTKNLLTTIILGMAVFFAWRFLVV